MDEIDQTITPEMLAAGVEALDRSLCWEEGPWLAAKAVYCAMVAARGRKPPLCALEESSESRHASQ